VVVVENVGFSSNVPEVQVTGMQRVMDQVSAFINTQPGVMKTLGVCVLGLLLVFMVLKPMTRQMMVMMKESPALALPAGGRGGQSGQSISGQNQAMLEGSGRAQEARSVFDQVSDHIRKEPAQSTRLLESWIAESGEAD